MIKNLSALWCAVSLIMLNVCGYSQNSVEIDFSGTDKQIKRTKKILRSSDLFLRIAGTDHQLGYDDSSYLFAFALTEVERSSIMNQRDVTLKIKRRSKCYISPFPNVFAFENAITGLMIYPIHRRKRILNLFTMPWFSSGMAINYNLIHHPKERSLSHNVPLEMIPCNNYTGEYDSGIHTYIDKTDISR